MSTTTLVTHCGACEVSREELNLIEALPPTQTYPVADLFGHGAR